MKPHTSTKSRKIMTSRFEAITPKKAQQWLDVANIGNRPLSRSHVARIARDMLAGLFVSTHQGIAFDTSGNLRDGQHRLTAVVESGVTVYMWVTRNVSDSAWDVMDRGQRSRQVADCAALRDLPYRMEIASAAKMAYMAKHGGFLNNKMAPTAAEVTRFIGKTPSVVRSAQMVMQAGAYKQLGSKSFQCYVYHMLPRKHRGTYLTFLDQLCEREDRKARGPAALLDKRLLANGLTGKDRQWLFLRAWRAFRDGEELRRLQIPTGRAYKSADFDPRV